MATRQLTAPPPRNGPQAHSRASAAASEAVTTQLDKQPEDKPTKKVEISLAQTVGGALAAMTAAAVGSRVGVGGTVVGAAMASVVAGIASTLYTASLRETGQRFRTVLWTGRDGKPQVSVTTVPDATVSTQAAEAPTTSLGVVDDTTLDAPAEHMPRKVVERRWKSVAAGALAAFGLAAVAVTGIEVITGNALSGEEGTTVGQVSSVEQPAPQPEPAAAEPSAAPSAADTPGPEASTTAPVEPTQTPSEVAPTPSAPSVPAEEPTPSTAPTDGGAEVPGSGVDQAVGG
jgi:hypothetical protein